MITLTESIKRNSVFLGLWLASVLALTIALILIDKGTLHLLLCDHHSAWADRLLPVLSDTCHWLPYALSAVLLLWRWQAGVFMSGSLILSTIITQTIKHIVRAPRPLTWFAENMPDVSLPLTEGINMHHYLSFPSGHSTTFFCLYFALTALFTYYSYSTSPVSANAFWAKLFPKTQATPSSSRKASPSVQIAVQLLFFSLAAVGSYSRIYLSQHFALDVLAGMLIGVFSVALVAHIFVAVMRRKPDTRTA